VRWGRSDITSPHRNACYAAQQQLAIESVGGTIAAFKIVARPNEVKVL
jgi:hypothetical protein